MVPVMFIIYILGVIITSLILKTWFSEETTYTTYECGTFVETTTDNINFAVLWPLFLIIMIFLFPLLISKHIRI
jgi:NADH:ubiquinone oxidoreductase subunit 3 (subunit A)